MGLDVMAYGSVQMHVDYLYECLSKAADYCPQKSQNAFVLPTVSIIYIGVYVSTHEYILYCIAF